MLRCGLRAICVGVLAASALVPAVAGAWDIKVTLLGTGCPPALMDRFGPSTLVEAGGQKFLVDAGRGALLRLNQAQVNWRDVQGVLFTHLHSDHLVGFPDLWLSGWITMRRETPLRVWGPAGTRRMMAHLEQAFEFDIGIRQVDDRASPAGVALQVEDVGEGVVYDNGGVRITAFEVDHPPIRPALGYRIDYARRSVVLSGDTKPSDNLVRHARGADLLVHEVAVPETFRRANYPPERTMQILAHHTLPEQAGEVFSRVKPGLAVYSHVCRPTATADDLVPATRKTYVGPLEVGEDLMVIEVGERIVVHEPEHDISEEASEGAAAGYTRK